MQNKHYLLSVIVLLALSLLFTTVSKSQQTQPSRTSFGITGSIGSSSHLNNFRFVSNDINLEFTPNFTTSFNAGFIVRHKLTRRFRLQAEPNLSRYGASYSEAFELRGFNFQTDSRTELLYFQLPVLFQFTTAPPERIIYGRQPSVTTYHFTGGAFGGYLLDAQFSGINSGAPIGIDFSGSFSNDIIDQYSDFDAGVVVGTGFEHGYATKVGMEGRIHFSVIDSGDAENFTFKPQNFAISFTGYFLF
ncbi:porin family protein [Rhodohalobacter sp. 8-1]|uniref:porin family protein n=1 Tax=Rhodohalobacter sp. 8-1 TaxID=3131972 RepID=UPI0030EBE370